MLLKSFGCSFIYGTDLADIKDTPGEPYVSASKSTWPALLSHSLGLDHECHARPGSGNLRILEKVLSQAALEPATFVIGWSWIDRYDHVAEIQGDPKIVEHCYDLVSDGVWRTILPVNTGSTARHYYRDLHSQFQDKLTSLIYIKTAIDSLNQKNIPFVMTYTDQLLFETQWHTSPAVIDLQNYVKPYMTTFEGLTFLEWTKQKGFPISETLHPLESAHKAAFELIQSYNLV